MSFIVELIVSTFLILGGLFVLDRAIAPAGFLRSFTRSYESDNLRARLLPYRFNGIYVSYTRELEYQRAINYPVFSHHSACDGTYPCESGYASPRKGYGAYPKPTSCRDCEDAVTARA